MTEYAQFDTSRLPFVVITFTGDAPTDENFDKYLREMKALYDSEEKISIVFDARQAVLPSLSFQKKQALWLKVNENLLKEYCSGTAYVITNKSVRVILRMIFAITPQPIPYKVCSNMDDAEEWARAQLTA